MLSLLTSLWAPRRYPSVVLILQPNPTKYRTLHIVPEDGAVELVSYTLPKPEKFWLGGGKEITREQLGTISLLAGSSEQQDQFLDKVSEHARDILKGTLETGMVVSKASSTEQALRTAVQAELKKWEERESSSETLQPCKVFLVHIKRRKPEGLSTEPKSIARW